MCELLSGELSGSGLNGDIMSIVEGVDAPFFIDTTNILDVVGY